MIINTPISIGELIDKISILTIKHMRIPTSENKNIMCKNVINSIEKHLIDNSNG